MATCEKCGDEFKPYWQLTEVQDKKCEKCEFLKNEGKNKRIWNALIKIVLGFLLVIIYKSRNFPLGIIGFLLVLFGIIKLVEDSIMHQRPKRERMRATAPRP